MYRFTCFCIVLYVIDSLLNLYSVIKLLSQSQFGFSVLECFQTSLILSTGTKCICMHGAALMFPFQVAYGL